MNRRDVYLQLASRRIRRDETIRQFVLSMQDLARHADIEERELVQFIVDGLGDPSAAVAMLYHANSIADLKIMLPVHGRYRTRPAISRTTPQHPVAAPPRDVANSNTPSSFGAPSTINPTRSFNCRQYRHLASVSPKPKRPIDGCFSCFETSHKYQDCPKRRRSGAVAAVSISHSSEPSQDANTGNSEEDFLANEIGALQLVSFEFNLNDRSNSKNL